MAKPENRMDFSPKPAAGSVTATTTPNYVLYGDTGTPPDWFVNLEPLEQRSSERGWIIAPHTHPRFTQVILCRDGGGEMTIDGERRAFGPASVMVVPPFRIHGFDYAEATSGWVLTIENNYLAGLLVRAPALEVVLRDPGVFGLDPAILPACEAELDGLAAELESRAISSAIGAEIRLLSILLLLLRHWPAKAPSPAVHGGRAETVRRFKDIVEHRFRKHPALPEIARELGVSVSQLRLACNSVAGMSPMALLHDRVVAEAKRCLAYSNMSIAEIADWLGFTDTAYFSRFFAKATSQTASCYRTRNNGSAEMIDQDRIVRPRR
ncbi:helix-turn-helix domain-containing protein [Sphingomonas sp. PB2P19]|uniref:helix-turn-helix domain-containing protein n=1 Tax=Sphingomonas rhamnosi TaxID=3096156 RepID=UPI002FCBFB68